MKKRIVLFFCMISILFAGCTGKEELPSENTTQDHATDEILETQVLEMDVSETQIPEMVVSETEVLIPTVDIVMVGDILLHTPVEKASLQ